MSLNFFKNSCQGTSDHKLFGLCDDPPPSHDPAYLDEYNGAKWIAIVNNEYRSNITFTAIDNCIEILRSDGKAAQRCDGMLTFGDTVIFVELKERSASGNEWVKDAEKQLMTTISYFEKTEEAEEYPLKKAYIANNQHPKFKATQAV